jgi:hypothetical protein
MENNGDEIMPFSCIRGIFYATFIFMIPLVVMLTTVLLNLLIATYTQYIMTANGILAIYFITTTISTASAMILDYRIMNDPSGDLP